MQHPSGRTVNNNGMQSKRLRVAQEYFDSQLDEFIVKYPGEYIAIVSNNVLSHGHDLDTVAREAYELSDVRPIFISKVEPPQLVELPIVNP